MFHVKCLFWFVFGLVAFFFALFFGYVRAGNISLFNIVLFQFSVQSRLVRRCKIVFVLYIIFKFYFILYLM